MGHYKSNLRDIEFTLFEVLGRADLLGQPPYEEIDLDTARSLLQEIDRLAREDLAASYEDADRNPPVYDAETKSVRVPESFKKSYRALMGAELWRAVTPKDLGGTPVPPSIYWGAAELVLGSNAAAWMYGSGPSFARVIWHFGTPEQKRIAEIMLDRGWVATMVLTEPDAGSDVGAGRATARLAGDGTWHLRGTKRFITNGDFDWPGVRIGNQMVREHDARPWRFSAADYRAAVLGAPRPGRPARAGAPPAPLIPDSPPRPDRAHGVRGIPERARLDRRPRLELLLEVHPPARTPRRPHRRDRRARILLLVAAVVRGDVPSEGGGEPCGRGRDGVRERGVVPPR